ncbi:winged helix-turn-helix domain-containing tetratricopeptide repeat protein [Alteromonas sp. BMJM2]|uniref:winged helix-turn-helix domain-containing tetratricopeptide repeat protein n=1 Tax=Alteromonas sp. BMJM2 TaxID=2954241 RepID=UPI0022B3BD3B|nr:winged helix-turn-helix domain-containing protein [Alteromonas sp. BMJM2]
MMDNFQLGKWTVSPNECTLKSADFVQNIEPKAMELLLLLAKSKGELVTRQEIMSTLWQGRYVTDFALNSLVSSLRKHLDKHDSNAFIKTRPKRGYQLIQTVQAIQPSKTISEVKDLGEQSPPTLNKMSPVKAIKLISLALIVLFLVVVLIQWLSSINQEKAKSIAVLSFSLMADTDDISYFADGLAEELIHHLAMVPEFKVISRTSSFAFRDTAITTAEIGDKLGVSYLLQGSVRQEAQLLKVNLQIIDADEDSTLWSQSFAASIDNAFSDQQQISSQVIATLGGKFDYIPDVQKRYKPSSGEAYLHLLRGRKYNQIRSTDSLLKARDEFTMATLLDPNYAEAYVDLAVSYLLMAQNKMLTLEEANREANKAIEGALKLDPKLSKAYAAKGILAFNNNQLDTAKVAFEKALALNGDQYLALINYGNLLRSNYQRAKALPYYERALEIAPLSSPANWGIGAILIGMGRLDDAISRYQRCVYRLPGDTNCVLGLAYALRLANQTEQANASFDSLDRNKLGQEYYYRMAQAWHHLWKGEPLMAEAIHESLLTQFGFEIEALQTITLTQYNLGNQVSWFERFRAAFQLNNKTSTLKANYGLAAFYANRCDIALPIFEELFTTQNQLFTDADLMANGVSYVAMLTYCYKQTDNVQGQQQIINFYASLIENPPKNVSFIPGLVYAQAQYFALVGNFEKSGKLLSTLRQSDWHLAWLIAKNPIFSMP